MPARPTAALLLLLALPLAGTTGGCRRGAGEEAPAGDAPPAVPVELARVERRDMPAYFTSTATIEAEKEATLLAKAHGQVVELLVEEGDRVQAGDTLARLDDAEYRARLGQAEVKANNARRESERAASMAAKGLISERELADVRYARELSASELEQARLDAGHTRILAPFDGVISARHLDLGEHAMEATPIFDLADTEPLLVQVYMPERQVSRIDLGQPALVEPDATPGVELGGRVVRVAPKVDPRTGTVKVTLELDGCPPAAARPGSFVRVRIRTGLHRNTVVMPRRALVYEAGESAVFLAESDTVRRVVVTTGLEDGDAVEVLDGLAAGVRVVCVGQGALQEGSRFVEAGAGGEAGEAGEAADDELAAAGEAPDSVVVHR